ncbi:MAG: polymer-forming cytoskeletal protein [Myxococcales bacterium FL481]|nr:MAG: polymer-forming cytoskeletal protein [Myxococcales bacterium FL481]
MASTVIGSSIVVDGEIVGDDDLLVLGTVKGRISVRDSVVVESGAAVEASVEASAITVEGSVTGDLRASDRADLRAGSRVVGDIHAPRIHIADGASFRGTVDMDG